MLSARRRPSKIPLRSSADRIYLPPGHRAQACRNQRSRRSRTPADLWCHPGVLRMPTAHSTGAARDLRQAACFGCQLLAVVKQVLPLQAQLFLFIGFGAELHVSRFEPDIVLDRVAA